MQIGFFFLAKFLGTREGPDTDKKKLLSGDKAHSNNHLKAFSTSIVESLWVTIQYREHCLISNRGGLCMRLSIMGSLLSEPRNKYEHA